MTSINIPNSVTSIDKYAFYRCSSLTSIDIPNSVTSIDEDAFAECSSLESVVIGDGISDITESTFYLCKNIRTILLGSNVRNIYKGNFSQIENLGVVACKGMSAPNLNSEVFKECNIENAKLIVPEESIETYKKAYIWKNFGTIEDFSGSEIEKCATPTIHYANGKLSFECETEGVNFKTTITCSDINSYYDNKINLSGTYIVKVTASKSSFIDSDTATAEINLLEGTGPAIKGDVDNDGYVNMSDVTDIINIILGKEQ